MHKGINRQFSKQQIRTVNKQMEKCLTLLVKEIQTKSQGNAIFVFQNGND